MEISIGDKTWETLVITS